MLLSGSTNIRSGVIFMLMVIVDAIMFGFCFVVCIMMTWKGDTISDDQLFPAGARNISTPSTTHNLWASANGVVVTAPNAGTHDGITLEVGNILGEVVTMHLPKTRCRTYL